MDVDVVSVRALRFDDGTPVRSASAVARFHDGWLVAQDDAAHAALVRGGSVTRLRLVPSVEGHDVFSSASGTKHLKPDLEAACEVPLGADSGVLLLGSGSTAARMRGVLVGPGLHRVTELGPLYARVAQVLGVEASDLNLEGACVVDDVLRWFARGNLATDTPSASVDLDLDELLAAVSDGDASAVAVRQPRTYDLGTVDGVGLTVTDAVVAPGAGILLTAAAEDTPNAVDDGPVVASAIALLEGDHVLAVVPLPEVDGRVAKVEGLAVLDADSAGVALLAVVDDDDPQVPSLELVLRVYWG